MREVRVRVKFLSDYDIYNIVADHEVGVGCDRARIVTYCYLSTNRYPDTDLGACLACVILPRYHPVRSHSL
jgi:hypothetical protein